MSDDWKAFCLFVVCATVLLVTLTVAIGVNRYRYTSMLQEGGYEEVSLPGQSRPCWQKIREKQ